MALTDTYDRRVQLEASRHRYRDAIHLQEAERWNGAIYLGGYAIECSLKALVCYEDCTMSLKETRIFKGGKWNGIFREGIQGAALHNLGALREASNILNRAIMFDKTGELNRAWNTIVHIWQKDALRYGRELGHKTECERFLKDVEILYVVILKKQGEDLE